MTSIHQRVSPVILKPSLTGIAREVMPKWKYESSNSNSPWLFILFNGHSTTKHLIKYIRYPQAKLFRVAGYSNFSAVF